MPGQALCREDEELLKRFGRRAIGLDEWTHEMHLRVGWMHVRVFGLRKAVDRLRDGIRTLNDANGIVNGPDSGYHETVTRVWAALIARADASDAIAAPSSAEFLRRHPELLDRKLPLRHYTRDRINSEAARVGWVEPDKAPLPELDDQAASTATTSAPGRCLCCGDDVGLSRPRRTSDA